MSNSNGNGPALSFHDVMVAYKADSEAKSQQCLYATSNGVPQPHPYETQRIGYVIENARNSRSRILIIAYLAPLLTLELPAAQTEWDIASSRLSSG